MITVIFNKNLETELTYQFDTYAELYNHIDGWVLRFQKTNAIFSENDGNFSDYLANLLNDNYTIITIDIFDNHNKLIDKFDDYHIISECLTYYEEINQIQRGELRLIKTN